MSLLEINLTAGKNLEEIFTYFLTDWLELDQFLADDQIKENSVIFRFYLPLEDENHFHHKLDHFTLELKQQELEKVDFLIEKKIIQEENWNESWKKYFTPIEIENKIRIRPPWEDSKAGWINLILDPKMGFGTGQHPTTYLCLKNLIHEPLQSKTVADIGAGSGILAAAALMMGAQWADCFEKDHASIESCEETLENNGVGLKSKVFHEDILENPDCMQKEYDIALINIIAEVIVEILKLEKIQKIPVLFLSGIIRERKDFVIKHLVEAGYQLVYEESKEDWIFLKAVR